MTAPKNTIKGMALGVFDVTAYGAVGNNSTDDTSAINAAIADLNTQGGGILVFPSQSTTTGYKVTGALTAFTGRTIVQGPGPIRPTTAISGSTSMFSDTVSAFYTMYRDLDIRSSSGADVNGIMITLSTDNSSVQNCFFRQTGQPIVCAASGGEDANINIVGNRFMQCNHSSSTAQNGLINVQSGLGPIYVRDNHFTSCNATRNATDALVSILTGNTTTVFFIVNNMLLSGTINNGVYIDATAYNNFVVDKNAFSGLTPKVNDNSTGTIKWIQDTASPSALRGGYTATLLTATNASWPIPAGAKTLRITMSGGGGGGGSGASNASGTGNTTDGGGGGGGGGLIEQVVSVGANTTLNATVGGGGAGGGTATGGVDGNTGTAGTNTTVTATGISLTARGGGAGGGGSSSSQVGGGGYANISVLTNANRALGGGAGAAQSVTALPLPGAGSGGAGGGGGDSSKGGTAGTSGSQNSGIVNAGTTGGSGTTAGVSATAAAANTGAGGGGGGSAISSATSGAGAAGGSGWILIEVVG